MDKDRLEKFNTEVEELIELCNPAVEYLKKNYNPYTKLVISMDSIEIIVTEIGIPLESKND